MGPDAILRAIVSDFFDEEIDGAYLDELELSPVEQVKPMAVRPAEGPADEPVPATRH